MSTVDDAGEGIATALHDVAGALRDSATIQGESTFRGLRELAASLDRIGDALLGIESALRQSQSPRSGPLR